MPAAARFYQRALALEPENPVVLNAVSITMLNLGRTGEAARLQQYRVTHDPANPAAYNNLGVSLYSDHRWDAAIDAFRVAIRLSPESAGTPGSLGLALLLGKHDAADALKTCETDSDEAARMQCRVIALHVLGRASDADAEEKAFADKFGSDQPGLVATAYAYRGDANAAFAWLDKAAVAHDPQVAAALSEPLFDSLHGDARWLPFLRRIGCAPEQLAKIEMQVKLPQ